MFDMVNKPCLVFPPNLLAEYGDYLFQEVPKFYKGTVFDNSGVLLTASVLLPCLQKMQSGEFELRIQCLANANIAAGSALEPYIRARYQNMLEDGSGSVTVLTAQQQEFLVFVERFKHFRAKVVTTWGEFYEQLEGLIIFADGVKKTPLLFKQVYVDEIRALFS